MLGERSPIAGTPYALTYQSDRVPGRQSGSTLTIPLTGANPPASIARVNLTVEVAGRTTSISMDRAANLAHTFVFDGKDAYGRPVQGRQKVNVKVDWVYPAVYRTPQTFAASFAQAGGARLSTATNGTRQEISLSQTWNGNVGGVSAPSVSALAGWNIDVHHTYDPVGRTLYLGDGTKRSAEGANYDVMETTRSGLSAPEGMVKLPDGALIVADSSAHVIRKVVPGGATTIIAGTPGASGFSGDGGPADEAEFDHPADVAVAPDGAIYVADQGNNRVRRIFGGTISTVAGTGDGGYTGDDGPALAAELDEPTDIAVDRAGSLFVVERANNVVRRIGANGVINTLAGNGSPGFGGDGLVATSARLRAPRDVMVAADGGVFIADAGNNRIRRVDPDGTIKTVAGDGLDTFDGDGGPATAAGLDTPSAIIPLRDGGMMIADAGHARLRKVNAEGRITTVAGNGIHGFAGDGGAAGRARVDFPQAIALGNDDTVYFADAGANRIRALAPSLPGLELGEITIPSQDGRSLFVFDRSGRHLRTVDTLTNEVVLRFAYDTRGRLIEIEDGDGSKTQIERDLNTGRLTRIVAPDGQATALSVSAGGYISSITNPGGNRIGLEYDAGGLLKRLTDPRNFVHSFDYDAAGRLIKDSAPGSFQTLSRSVFNRVVTVTRTSGQGRTTAYRTERLADGSFKRTVTDEVGPGDDHARRPGRRHDGHAPGRHGRHRRTRARPALRHGGAADAADDDHEPGRPPDDDRPHPQRRPAHAGLAAGTAHDDGHGDGQWPHADDRLRRRDSPLHRYLPHRPHAAHRRRRPGPPAAHRGRRSHPRHLHLQRSRAADAVRTGPEPLADVRL